MSIGLIVGVIAAGLIVFALARGTDESVRMPGRGGPADSESIEGAIAAGRKIEAIKLYREEHGVGLREAKEAVEKLARSVPNH